MLDFELPDFDAWASLLGLLEPLEYFVTVDHSVLWQRHVAWAKPQGEKLRAYVTQRFSSNMVVLSLMLATEINVFFNSSQETAHMRGMLASESYGNLKYWIGILIALDACVTVMAIVTSFTAWSMIGSLSDTNTHAMLRSSIGQYVISLPSRFVVAALYLFMIWLTLFFVDLIRGPVKYVMIVVVLILFFQVIVPLSAFGRLVIHTGAMAKRRVLDEQFEKELLPSGLHASLLIRATNRRRKYTSAILQYTQKRSSSKVSTSLRSSPVGDASTNASAGGSTSHLTTQGRNASSGLEQPHVPSSRARARAQTSDTVNSGEFIYPQASVLNSATSFDLKAVVEAAILSDQATHRYQPTFDSFDADDSSNQIGHHPRTITFGGSNDNGKENREGKNATFALPDEMLGNKRPELPSGAPGRREQFAALRRPHHRRILSTGSTGGRRVQEEWNEEEEVRDLYNLAPPAEIINEEDVVQMKTGALPVTTQPFFPRASFMNKARGLASLRKLITRQEDLDTPESSIDENNSLVEDLDDSDDDLNIAETQKRVNITQQQNGPTTANKGGETERLLPPLGKGRISKYAP